jgi:hypothetical protein
MINDLWYNNAVIYCLSVGAFMDSDGDGVGAFKGRAPAGLPAWRDRSLADAVSGLPTSR